MTAFKRFRFWGRSPLTIVEFVIAFTSVLAGIYIASPLLAYSTMINGAGSLVTTLGNPVGLIIYGCIYALSGLLIIAGIITRRYVWRSSGLFINICARIYGLAGVFITSGFLPLTWLSAFVLLIIAIICYIVVRGFVVMGDING